MASSDDAITRWFDVQRGHSSRFLSCSNIDSSPGVLYSYGQHFPLVRPINDDKGQRLFWLLNGDRFSVTTATHQQQVRSQVRGDAHVIIPQSVLEAASIDIKTMRLLDVTRDRMVTTEHSSVTPPPRMTTESVIDERMAVALTDDEILVKVEKLYCTAVTDAVDGLDSYANADADDFMRRHYTQKLNDLLSKTPMELYGPGVRNGSDWYSYSWHRTVSLHAHDEHKVGYRRVDLIDTVDGPRYVWETSKHWLGESLIQARVPHYIRHTTCKDCGGTGWASVGMLDGRWGFTGRCYSCHNGKTAKQVWRTTKFLSGFDRNETRESYFFCELPATDAVTVDDAIEALKPQAVRIAEQVGRDVVRQGDIFGIAAPSMTRRALTAAGATYAKRGTLLGTNHVATETATLPDGSLYARGTLTHAPDFRDPDHARCTLPKGWSLIVKNTVPLGA